MPKKFYSQFGEDKYVFDTFFSDRTTPGIYFEAGAMDGISLSNTKAFEEMGWTGVLVEPMPENYKKLLKNRPRDKCFSVILDKQRGSKTLAIHDKLPNVSSVVENNTGHNNYWHKDDDGNNTSRELSIPTDTMGNVLKTAGVTHIDFISLDIEGYEAQALSGMDWSIPVGVWCIETSPSGNDDNNTHKIRRMLSQNGYTFYRKFHINDIWVGRNLEKFTMPTPPPQISNVISNLYNVAAPRVQGLILGEGDNDYGVPPPEQESVTEPAKLNPNLKFAGQVIIVALVIQMVTVLLKQKRN
ncbi:MAG: hypothetical protein CMM25_01305 [Rhodospirillaceae bacterium]|nr:hypothetical protein [Rhodospirillaceae bacterium]